MENLIFLPYNVPSLKNGKIKGKNGIFHSVTVRRYLSAMGIASYSARRKEVVHMKTKEPLLLNIKDHFRKLSDEEKPYLIGFHFVRDSKRKFDFNNANQLLADLFVAYDFIPDDDMSEFIPYALKLEGKYYTVDKENPGVYIKL